MRKYYLIIPIAAFLGVFLPGCGSVSYDVLIKGGTVLDGTGGDGFRADVAILGGNIQRIGDLPRAKADLIVDAQGMYVVPGFIDMHTHSENVRDEKLRSALNYLTQGVTTMVTGNCGSGTFQVTDFFAKLEKSGVGTNIVHLVGHGAVRRKIMGSADRAPTPEELQAMKALVASAMEQGAAGLSSGLFYAPGSFADTDEVIELCRVAGLSGGIYATHLRDESDYTIGLKAAVKEAIVIGENAGIPVQISHIKALGRSVWGYSDEICRLIEEAQDRGVRVLADQYPYTASSTNLAAAAVPRWVQADGLMNERLRDISLLPRIKREILENVERRCGPENLVISSFPQKKDMEGKSLAEIGSLLQKSIPDTVVDLVLSGSPGVISYNMSEEDVQTFMAKPYIMTGSDGSSQILGSTLPHPRSYGTFPRKIRKYVLEKELLTMAKAVRAASGLPAEMLGFKDRGLLKEEYVADIVVFDPENIADRATFESPHQYSQGILWVFISGRPVIDEGEYTGVLAGKPLRLSEFR